MTTASPSSVASACPSLSWFCTTFYYKLVVKHNSFADGSHLKKKQEFPTIPFKFAAYQDHWLSKKKKKWNKKKDKQK